MGPPSGVAHGAGGSLLEASDPGPGPKAGEERNEEVGTPRVEEPEPDPRAGGDRPMREENLNILKGQTGESPMSPATAMLRVAKPWDMPSA